MRARGQKRAVLSSEEKKYGSRDNSLLSLLFPIDNSIDGECHVLG
jgi:hypothetical protein